MNINSTNFVNLGLPVCSNCGDSQTRSLGDQVGSMYNCLNCKRILPSVSLLDYEVEKLVLTLNWDQEVFSGDVTNWILNFGCFRYVMRQHTTDEELWLGEYISVDLQNKPVPVLIDSFDSLDRVKQTCERDVKRKFIQTSVHMRNLVRE